MNIVATIREETSRLAGKVAVIEGARQWTYAELFAAADAVARSLADAGVQPGQRIAFLCEDSFDYIAGTLGILAVKAVAVPVSPSLMAREVEAVLRRIDVHALLYDAAVYRHAAGVPLASAGFPAKACRLLRRTAVDRLPPDYFALEPAFIRFSSGTTGESKGVVLSHRAILERTQAADRGLEITAEDVIPWVLSMSFHFVVTILLFLRRGATVVLCQRQFPESFWQALSTQAATLLYASPFHYRMLLNAPQVTAGDLRHIRLAVSTAMKLPDEIAREFAAKFGRELAEAYGIIEVGLPFVNRSGDPAKRGSVGRALPDYQVRIDQPDAGGAGEILLRGPGMFAAYFSPWQTRSEATVDGWFRTGDLGRLDPVGYLTIVGRHKQVINFTGMKIFPEEVEAVINRYPGVRESLVYGVAHPYYGQWPHAQIALQAGAAQAFDLGGLRRFCFRELAPYQVPKEFHIVEKLIKTASGKIRRDV
jgi:long-chain acyl-CoA synthetase